MYWYYTKLEQNSCKSYNGESPAHFANSAQPGKVNLGRQCAGPHHTSVPIRHSAPSLDQTHCIKLRLTDRAGRYRGLGQVAAPWCSESPGQ